MIHSSVRFSWSLNPRASTLIFLLMGAGACGGDAINPDSNDSSGGSLTNPGDSTVVSPGDSSAIPPGDSTIGIPVDSSATPPGDSTAGIPADSIIPIPPGIVFAAFDLDNWLLGAPYNGSFRLPGPEDLVRLLSGARAKGGRIILGLCNHDYYVQSSTGTFSLDRWKEQVARFKDVNFDPYIDDGTLIGHMLLDEPDDPSNWGDEQIPQATIEEMAKFSKQLWPRLTTFVRSKPTYLGATGIRFKYLDAGWTMYESWKGEPRAWLKGQVAAAKKAGLGLVVGLNVLNGGTSASGIKGTKGEHYSMSASQIRKWGAIMMDEPYGCAFFVWKYSFKYNKRSDIKSALNELAVKARTHPETPCRR